jgi:hypothetical protein
MSLVEEENLIKSVIKNAEQQAMLESLNNRDLSSIDDTDDNKFDKIGLMKIVEVIDKSDINVNTTYDEESDKNKEISTFNDQELVLVNCSKRNLIFNLVTNNLRDIETFEKIEKDEEGEEIIKEMTDEEKDKINKMTERRDKIMKINKNNKVNYKNINDNIDMYSKIKTINTAPGIKVILLDDAEKLVDDKLHGDFDKNVIQQGNTGSNVDNEQELIDNENRMLIEGDEDKTTQEHAYTILDTVNVDSKITKEVVEQSPFIGGMFISPDEIDSLESNSDSSSSDESENENVNTKTRSNWKKKEYKESGFATNVSNNDDIETIKNIINTIDKKFIARLTSESDTVNDLVKLKTMLIEKRNNINKKIDNKLDQKRRVNLLKDHISGTNIKYNSYFFVKKRLRVLQLSQNIEGLNNIVDIYDDLENILKTLPRFDEKFIYKSLGVSLAKIGVTDGQITSVFSNFVVGPSAKIGGSLLDGFVAYKMLETNKEFIINEDIEEVGFNLTMVNTIKPTFEYNGKRYESSVLFSHNIQQVVDMRHNNDSVVKSIIQNAKLIVLDLPNMIKAMNLSFEDVQYLSEMYNEMGITTLAVIENTDSALEKIMLNIVIDDDEHDDIISILYAQSNQALIITCDKHSEFNEIISYCATHRQILIRKGELCSEYDETCCTRSIKLQQPKYVSIKKVIFKKDTLQVHYNKPVIRTRRTKITGETKSVYKFLHKTAGIKLGRHKFCERQTTWITTCMNVNPKVNFNVMTLSMDDLCISVLDYGRYTAISHILNNLNEIQMTKLKDSCNGIVDLDIDNNVKITLQDGTSIPIKYVDPVTKMRHKNSIHIVSSLLRTQDIIPITNKYNEIDTIVDNNFKMKRIMTSLIISKTMLNNSICIAKSPTKMMFMRLSEKLKSKIIDDDIISNSQQMTDLTSLIRNSIVPDDILIHRTKYYQTLISGTEGDITTMNNDTNQFKNMTCGPPLYRQLESTDISVNQIMIDMTNIEIIDMQIHNKIKLTKTRNVEYYNSSVSMSYYNTFRSMKDSNTPSIKFKLSSEENITTFTRLSDSDAKLLCSAFERNAKSIINKIIYDISAVFATAIRSSYPYFLPIFVWAYKDTSMEIMDKNKKLLVELKFTTPDYSCDVLTVVTEGKAVTVLYFKPSYFMLLTHVALLYGNNYANTIGDTSLMEFDIEVQFDVLCNDTVVAANADQFFEYFKVFSIPLRLLGLHPFEELVKFKSIVVDNVVEKFVQSDEKPYWSSPNMKGGVTEMIMFEMMDDIYGAVPLVRSMIGNKFNIADEIHQMIDQFAEMKEYGFAHVVRKYLPFFRPLYKISDIVMHLVKCYNLVLPSNPTYNEIVLVIENNDMRSYGVCNHQHNEDCVTYADVGSSMVLSSHKQISTSKGIFSIMKEPNFQITRYKIFENEWMLREMPMSGMYTMIIIKQHNKQDRINRYDIVKNLMDRQRQLIIDKEIIVVHFNTNVNVTLEDHLVKSFKKNKSVIIIATDRIGSLIKSTQDNIVINNLNKNEHKIYVPDDVLFNALRSKMVIEDAVEVLKVKTNAQAKDIIDKRIKKGKNKKRTKVANKIKQVGKNIVPDNYKNKLVSDYNKMSNKHLLAFIIVIFVLITIIILATKASIIFLWPYMSLVYIKSLFTGFISTITFGKVTYALSFVNINIVDYALLMSSMSHVITTVAVIFNIVYANIIVHYVFIKEDIVLTAYNYITNLIK